MACLDVSGWRGVQADHSQTCATRREREGKGERERERGREGERERGREGEGEGGRERVGERARVSE